jgi:hypothetical protein
LKVQLVAYAQAFLHFVLPPFVAPFLARMSSKTRFGTISMGGVEEGTRTMMEVDSIVVKVITKSIQVAYDTIKIVHPSTLYTIVKTEESTQNL